MDLGAREKQQSRNYNGLGEHMPPVLSKMQKHQNRGFVGMQA